MRIRTIKPEFWSHPVLIRTSHFTRLLAIALLNYSDDHGYFLADEDMIRGAVFPKENSTTIRRSLDELSSIDYCEIRDHKTHGPIGFVKSFSKHQKVDRPKYSSFKELYDSTIDRRLIDDDSTINRRGFDEASTEEGKGREGKGMDSLRILTNSLSTDVDVDGVRCSWNDFAESVGLAKIETLNPKRKQSINARQKDGMIEKLPTIFNEIRDSDFLLGVTGRDSWKGVSFDWLFCSPNNWPKIIEGKYRNKKPSSRPKQEQGEFAAIERLF